MKSLKCEGGLEIFNSPGFLGFGGNWGIRDSTGNVVIEAKYRAVHCFSRGIAWVATDSQKAWCPVGPDGVIRNPLACRTQFHAHMTSGFSPAPMSSDPYESSVLWMRALYDHAIGKRSARPPETRDERRGRPRV